MVVVAKIGGSLLTSAHDYMKVVEKIKELAREDDVIVVVSAMKGVTSKLIETLSSENPERELREIFAKHISILEAVSPSPEKGIREMSKLLDEALNGIRRFKAGMIDGKDIVLSMGERLSIIILREALRRENIRGVSLEGGIAGIITDEEFGNAKPIMDECMRTIPSVLLPILGEETVPVVAGFTGVTRDGRITTLGRGGSDLTASLIASVLRVRLLLLYTDVPGIMTGDPSTVNHARTIPAVGLEEADAMARLRVKKFHPLTFMPIMRLKPRRMGIFIGTLDGRGTRVVRRRVPPPIKVVSPRGGEIVVIGHDPSFLLDIVKPEWKVSVVATEEPYAIVRPENVTRKMEVLDAIHSAILKMIGG